jgi:glycosyltransferase involved in cell wall biosynthesis
MCGFFLDRASVYLCLSHHAAQLLAHRYPAASHKIAWLPPMPIGPIPEQIEPNHREKVDPVRLLIFGCLRPDKGIELALEALAILNRRSPLAGRAELLIRGRMTRESIDTDYRKRVKDYIERLQLQRLVSFIPGAIPAASVNELLREADVLVLPYRPGACESVSKTLLRAETWCVAPVASDTGSMREMIQHGSDGLIFPTGNAAALADCLESLIKNPDMRRDMALARRRRALNQRSAAQVSALMLALYREMLQARDENRPVRVPAPMRVPGVSPEPEDEEETVAETPRTERAHV